MVSNDASRAYKDGSQRRPAAPAKALVVSVLKTASEYSWTAAQPEYRFVETTQQAGTLAH
jgi:hypothetical protein